MTPVTLANCEQEPIHIPGAIQPHGAAIVCAPGTLIVEQVSANLEALLGVTPEAAIGAPVDALFNTDSAALVRGVGIDEAPRARGATVVQARNGQTFDAIVHRTTDAVIVELEPHTVDLVGYHPILREAVARFQTTKGIQELCAISAIEVRRLTGFDRVMIYRFDAEWNGEVIAESKRDDIESFLGHHYPASDIPAQARRLYTINWLRLIPDAAYRPCPLVPPLRPSGEPLDLSHAVLRSVSPIHCEYLANMGVRASMSISLLRDGQLWGLIACHHYAGPNVVPFVNRDSAEFLGQTLSWLVGARESALAAERERDSQRIETELVREMTSTVNFADGLAVPALLGLTHADGAAVIFEDDVRLVGTTPSQTFVRRLAEWLRDRADDEVFVTDKLSEHFTLESETVDVASGVLAVAISRNHREFVIWFRPSTERVVPWAGNPTKVLDPGADRLSPRGSFALWYETVRGRSLPWQPSERAAAEHLRGVILGGVRRRAAELRLLAERLAAADTTKDALLASVSHELRTPLNAILGWARILRTRQHPEKLAHALDVIERNAQAQTQLIDDLLDVARMTAGKLFLDVQPTDLLAVIRSSLESVTLAAEARDIRLGTASEVNDAIVIGDPKRLQQVIWNLVTNSIKFTPKGGRVDVGLVRVSSEMEITVTDTGQGMDPEFIPHAFQSFRQGGARDHRGLGLGLAISRHIVELHGGTISAESRGKGLGTTMRVRLPTSPLRARGTSASVEPSSSESEALAIPDTRLAGYRVMVLEDEPDSRDLLASLLTDLGAVVTTYGMASAALAAVPVDKPDVIVADIGLPIMDGHSFARHLRALPPDQGGNTPAVAVTAFARPRDRTVALTAGFQHYVSKPIDAEELIAVLLSVLTRTTPVSGP